MCSLQIQSSSADDLNHQHENAVENGQYRSFLDNWTKRTFSGPLSQ